MVVYVSNSVKTAMNAYRRSLRKYPITRERAIEKYNLMVNALLSLGDNHINCRPCVHKDLGQRFDKDRKPIYKNLYRFNYQDKSKFTCFALRCRCHACRYENKFSTSGMPSTPALRADKIQ